MQFVKAHKEELCHKQKITDVIVYCKPDAEMFVLPFFEDIERRIAFSTFLSKPSQLVCAVMVWVTTTLLLTKIYTKPEYK